MGSVLKKMRQLNNQMEPRTNLFFLKRLLKYMTASVVMAPHLWGIAIRLVQGLGMDWESLVTAASRGFPGPDLIGALRRRCSVPSMKLLNSYGLKKYFLIWPDSVYILSSNKGVETERINVVDQKFSQAGN